MTLYVILVWRSHTLRIEEEGSGMVSTECLCSAAGFLQPNQIAQKHAFLLRDVVRKWPPIVEIVRNLSGIQVLRTSKLE